MMDVAQPSRPYLDYYISNAIIPVRQDMSDLSRHFARRAALYRHMGILPALVAGRSVIEFGPGTGDNAVYTAALKPARYVLVDGNPHSVAHLEQQIRKGHLPAGTEVIQADVGQFSDNRLFDLVLCEGLVHMQDDPSGFFLSMARFTAPGGLVVATTHSAISLFSEICRRLIYPIFARRTPDRATLLSQLVGFFAEDLSYLEGMSRLPEDWVQDNIMHPWPEPQQLVFTVEDAIDALGEGFELLGTSPRFLQDFRWYKSVPEDQRPTNEILKAEVERWSLAFLDRRAAPAPMPDHAGQIEAMCRTTISLCNTAWASHHDADIEACLVHVARIAAALAPTLPETATSLNSFIPGVRALMAGHEANFGDFRSFFGRAQQYVCFIRTLD